MLVSCTLQRQNTEISEQIFPVSLQCIVEEWLEIRKKISLSIFLCFYLFWRLECVKCLCFRATSYSQRAEKHKNIDEAFFLRVFFARRT